MPPPIVVDASERIPPEKVRRVVVAFEGNGYPMVLVMVTAPVEPESEIPEPATLEVTPVLVMVRPEPRMDCPPVTEIPVPEETVPVAVE